MIKVPRNFRIAVDSREKRPLLFPAHLRYFDEGGKPHLVRLETVVETLPYGDYCPAGNIKAVAVERKGSAEEIAGNLLTSDRRRALSSLRRLAEGTEQPILLLDFPISQLMGVEKGRPAPGEVISALLRLVRELGLSLIHASSGASPATRRNLGSIVAHMLLEGALSYARNG